MGPGGARRTVPGSPRSCVHGEPGAGRRAANATTDPAPPRWPPLEQGLEAHGVGRWREMSADHPELQRYTDQYLRLRTARLLGTQSLVRHMGWRGDRAAIDAQHAKHKALGERLGCWKGGMLVEDNHGSVAKALAELGDAAAAGALE